MVAPGELGNDRAAPNPVAPPAIRTEPDARLTHVMARFDRYGGGCVQIGLADPKAGNSIVRTRITDRICIVNVL